MDLKKYRNKEGVKKPQELRNDTGVGGWLDPLGAWTPGPNILGQMDRESNCPAGQMDPPPPPPWMDGPTIENA